MQGLLSDGLLLEVEPRGHPAAAGGLKPPPAVPQIITRTALRPVP